MAGKKIKGMALEIRCEKCKKFFLETGDKAGTIVCPACKSRFVEIVGSRIIR